MAFQKTWRAYQSRLLSHFDSYIEDRRFHVVAAPGSGKTVLGLEIIRRIGQATLVLTPTITIRDQWAERLVDHFLPAHEGRPSWVSTDLRSPALLTIATYQALHALCCGHPGKELTPFDDEESAGADAADQESGDGETAMRFAQQLAQADFRTLVVDEAHHLRAEWWKTLSFVMQHLERPVTVALTATPPYDVSPNEWQRYQELCGPVDAQVSIPELVLQGDLCPHQDYVYFSTPTPEQQQELSAFRAAVDSFVQRLRSTALFTEALKIHPWILFPDSHVEEILDRPHYLSSIVIYLKASGVEISPDLLRILGLPKKRIPALNLEWLEILLSNCLFTDAKNFAMCEAIFKAFRRDMRAMEMIEHRKVRLRNPSRHTRLLATSATKLKSIEEIVRLESGAQGDRLRCVVLADFIRKDELPSQDGEAGDFEDIGVAPIFETLRRARLENLRLGVLSGSLVLIPAAAAPLLQSAAEDAGVRPEDLSLTPLPHDSGFLQVELRGEYYQGAVRLMTQVFEQGGIRVLVGTKSLLGEGWDAPCINTLVLASFVGSYVLSNQMRGRSIRIDPRDPNKTANIWHLVCLEPGESGPGEDYRLLVRRCRGFAGVSPSSAIETGTERLGFGDPPFSVERIAQMNQDTRRQATDRDALRRLWQKAIASGADKVMVNGLKSPTMPRPREFVLKNTLPYFAFQTASVSLAVFLQLMHDPSGVGSIEDLLQSGAVAAGIAAAVTLPWGVRNVWRLIRHGTPQRSMRQTGRAVLDALIYEGSINPPSGRAKDITVHTNKNRDGTVVCWIDGKEYEQAIFARALNEVLGPIESPRYLLARRPLWGAFREDYFAVPEALSRKKEFADFFAQKWRRLVGPVELVHTRVPEGRRVLLRARIHSFTAAFQKQSEQVSCWK